MSDSIEFDRTERSEYLTYQAPGSVPKLTFKLTNLDDLVKTTTAGGKVTHIDLGDWFAKSGIQWDRSSKIDVSGDDVDQCWEISDDGIDRLRITSPDGRRPYLTAVSDEKGATPFDTHLNAWGRSGLNKRFNLLSPADEAERYEGAETGYYDLKSGGFAVRTIRLDSRSITDPAEQSSRTSYIAVVIKADRVPKSAIPTTVDKGDLTV